MSGPRSSTCSGKERPGCGTPDTGATPLSCVASRGGRDAGASRGFTLIEVLVSLFILSIGLVAVLRALDTSVIAVGEARDAVVAASDMQTRLAGAVDAAREGESRLLGCAGDWRLSGGLVGVLAVEKMRLQSGAPDTAGGLYAVTVTVGRDGRARHRAATLVRVASEEPKQP